LGMVKWLTYDILLSCSFSWSFHLFPVNFSLSCPQLFHYRKYKVQLSFSISPCHYHQVPQSTAHTKHCVHQVEHILSTKYTHNWIIPWSTVSCSQPKWYISSVVLVRIMLCAILSILAIMKKLRNPVTATIVPTCQIIIPRAIVFLYFSVFNRQWPPSVFPISQDQGVKLFILKVYKFVTILAWLLSCYWFIVMML
jgi:hypothetical protein